MQQQQQAKGIDIVVQGRIVWGGVKPSIKKTYGTNTPYIDPKTGQQVTEWVFGLAIPKINPSSNQAETDNFMKFWNAVHQQAAMLGVQQGDKKFHWKFVDGDGLKDDGSPYPDHSKGHYILTCKTRIPLKLMAWENGKCVQITDDQIKCGDYVQVALNIDGHGNPNAGLYVNPSYVARVGYGQAIINQQDPTEIFGSVPPPMPMGASSTPIGGAPMQVPGFGFGNAAVQPPPQQQAAAPIQPHYGILPGQFNPATQQQTPQVPGGMAYGQPNAAGPGMPQQNQQPMMGNGAQQGMNPQNGFVQPGPQFGGPMNAGPTAHQPAYPSNPGMPQGFPTGYNGQ